MEVKFWNHVISEGYENWDYKYAVIFARYNNRMLFCRHKERMTYECPGGHREPGETVFEAAKRELYEETGAVRFEMKEIGPYSVKDEEGERLGMLYFAEILELGPLPESEIGEIQLFDDLPENWTYPEIQPELLKKVKETIVWDRE